MRQATLDEEKTILATTLVHSPDGGEAKLGAIDRATALLDLLGSIVLRYGLVAILIYFGAFKFTAVEAKGIEPLISNSPFMAWMYSVLSVQGVSNLIGVTELVAAALIATRPFAPKAAFFGSLLAVGMFVTTLSFLVTTPGSWGFVEGFPLPVPTAIGGFIMKDWFLLGAALWSAAEAGKAGREK